MPRKRQPFRLDEIVDAATDVFIQEGFARARIDRIARLARTAAGTIYLYVESKGALFDLALRRALGDPSALDPPLPVQDPSRDQILTNFQRCLHAASHLPQLWVALDHREPVRGRTEMEAVLRELWTWLSRYRRAILLVRASAADWPGLPQRLDREFHAEAARRLAEYLHDRAAAGALRPLVSPQATAAFILTTLAASALGLGIGGEVAGRVPGALDEDAAVGVLLGGLLP